MEEAHAFQKKQASILEFLSELACKTENGERIQALNQMEYHFYITMSLLQEVVDGQGSFWFFLKSGNFFEDLEKAFAAIGSSEASEVCRRVLNALGENIPSDVISRKNMVHTMDLFALLKILHLFDEMDQSFIRLQDTLIELGYAFLLKNKPRPPAVPPNKDAVPNPFRDNPYIFRCSGIQVYWEYGNPYETVEIYLDMDPEFIGVKSHISEHGPDGISSWHGVFLDAQNSDKLMQLVGKNIAAYLRSFFRKYPSTGILAFTDFLDRSGISYKSTYAY